MKKKKGKINLKLTLSPIEGHILDFISFSLGGGGVGGGGGGGGGGVTICEIVSWFNPALITYIVKTSQ